MHHKKELQELMRTYSSMKALQLLVALADCEGEISLAQLSAATGIPPSSTHRILQEMQHCGFVIKDEVKKCYRAGFEARLLAIQLQKTNFLYEAARGEMAYLNDLSHCTGGGKAILAWKSESWLENYLAHVKRERFTGKTLTDAEDLRRELEVIRIQGYAVDNHEHHTDVVCIAAPVFDVDNQVLAAIGIAAPDYRFSL